MTFQKPLLTTDSSGGRVQVYYACPRCLSRVDDVKESKYSEEKQGNSTSVKKDEKNAGEHAVAGCKHFLGYLRKRPKDSAISDECLVCERMIECLTR
ncbi:MAG: hypothetical protein C0193_02330 [Candidatus Bathyarchaeota archaeon]|nr:MAG: hypothetical protein C0193_02330 [Candidatus Bathyarchaeota archaeon]